MPLPHFTHNGHIFLTDAFGYLYLPFPGLMIPLPYDEALFLKRCEEHPPDALVAAGRYEEAEAQAFCEYLSTLQEKHNCFNTKYNERFYIQDFRNIDIIFNIVLVGGHDGKLGGGPGGGLGGGLDDDARRFLSDIVSTHATKANAVHFALINASADTQARLRDALDDISARTGKPFVYSCRHKSMARTDTHVMEQTPVAHGDNGAGAPYDLLERFLRRLHIADEPTFPDLPADLDARLDTAFPAFEAAARDTPKRFARLLGAVFQFAQNRKRFFNCAAGINSLTCDLASGEIRACTKAPSALGTFADGLETAARAALFRAPPIHRDDCLACWCRYFCAGGCRVTATPPDCAQVRTVYAKIGMISLRLQEKGSDLFDAPLYSEIQSYHECLFTLHHDSCVMDRVSKRLGVSQ